MIMLIIIVLGMYIWNHIPYTVTEIATESLPAALSQTHRYWSVSEGSLLSTVNVLCMVVSDVTVSAILYLSASSISMFPPPVYHAIVGLGIPTAEQVSVMDSGWMAVIALEALIISGIAI